MFQVGAVIAYTIVYHMLAPPPEVADVNGKSPITVKVEVPNGKTVPIPQMTYDDDYEDSIQAPLLHPQRAPSKLVKVLKAFSSHQLIES